MKLLNNPSFRHAKWLIDESYVGSDSRRSGSASSVLYSWVMQQMRKRDIEVIWVVQNSRMLDWRIKWIVTKRVICLEYDWDDEKQRGTHKVKCIIKNIQKGTEKTVRYYAPQYWKYFDTDELPDIPQRECACGCGTIVISSGSYLPGHYMAKRDADKAAKELAGASNERTN
jgi:hypothetical protein